MKKPLRVWSADRGKRYGIVAEDFQNLKLKASAKLGVKFCEDSRLVLEEDGTAIDESYWETLKDHTRIILLQPGEVWKPDTIWPPNKVNFNFDSIDGGNERGRSSPEELFMKLQQNPAVMVLLDFDDMETIKDTDVDLIDGKCINKELAKGIQEKCIEIYLTRKKEEEALEVLELLKQKMDVCG